MPFDMSFVYDIQNMMSQFEKIAIGLPVLIFLASLARFLLWTLLTPVAGRALGGLLANIILAVGAVVLLTHPPLAWAAVDYSYSLASRFIGGAGGPPGTGALDQAVREFDNAFNQLTSVFN
jgi:hypothetical protein